MLTEIIRFRAMIAPRPETAAQHTVYREPESLEAVRAILAARPLAAG